METASGKAEQIGFYETVLGDAARIFRQLDAYRAVQRDEVSRLVRERLVSSQRTTLLVRASGDGADQEAA
jgi:zinc protease